MPKFTKQELKLLGKYVSDPSADIFAVSGLQGVIGPAYARYSRAKGSFLQTFLKEFVKEGKLDAIKAKEVIERILVAFGDDSVGELEGCHVSFEKISNIATKEIEDRRIGGSPIEQSTRYVVYDQKDDDGRWQYLRVPEIMRSRHAVEYEKFMDDLFETYASMVDFMQEYYKKQKPLEAARYDILGTGEKQSLAELNEERDIKAFKRTYTFDLRTKTCDTIRVLLPAAVKTNMGVFGNGRFFQNVLTHLYTHELEEMNDIAKRAHKELDKTIPVFVKRAKCDDYAVRVRQNMQRLAKELLGNKEPEKQPRPVMLLPREIDQVSAFADEKIEKKDLAKLYEKAFEINIIAQMLFPFARHRTGQIRRIVRDLPDEKRRRIVSAYIGDRVNRRCRPGRALEYGYDLTFEIVGDFGIYRDLQRHRMATQERQMLTPDLGFFMPQDLVEAGFADKINEYKDKSARLYEKIKGDLGPAVAQYAVLFGYNIRWIMGMNDREAMHLIELRTVAQGHPNYRKVAQEMHKEICAKRSGWRGDIMKFVDYNEYYWARADSEARQRAKEKELDDKYGS